MKRTNVILILAGALLLIAGGIVIFQKQHYLKRYYVPTTALEPGIPLGSVIWASSLKEYDRYDFVIFKQSDTAYFVFRVIGMPGETIYFKDDGTYINNNNVDGVLTLKHGYVMSGAELDVISEEIQFDYFPGEGDNYIAHVIDSVAISRNYKRWRFPSDSPDTRRPVQLEEDEVFLMGDNRDNAIDSRVLGPVQTEDIISVVLNR